MELIRMETQVLGFIMFVFNATDTRIFIVLCKNKISGKSYK